MMKGTRLKQDLERVHEQKDRAAALDAVSKRLKKLQDAHARIKPATPAAQRKADSAKALLTVIGAALTKARAKGTTQKEQVEEDF